MMLMSVGEAASLEGTTKQQEMESAEHPVSGAYEVAWGGVPSPVGDRRFLRMDGFSPRDVHRAFRKFNDLASELASAGISS